MAIINRYFKIFPEYEEVFYDDLENHKKYFLPLCSINLQCIFPNRDEWLHFVSVKEIYDGRVGQNTSKYHTEYTREDSFGFNVIEGKYKFDSDWNFFEINTEILPGNYNPDYSDAEIEYNMNTAKYDLLKKYYQEYNELYKGSFYRPGLTVNDIRRLERIRQLTPEDLRKDEVNEYIAEQRQGKIGGVFSPFDESESSLEETDNVPYVAGKMFECIGYVVGYDFQMHGADQVHLFYDKELKKAVVTLQYS